MSTCTDSQPVYSFDPEFSNLRSMYSFFKNKAQLPPETSKVLYFPQGHIERFGNLDSSNCPSVPSSITCRVSENKFTCDTETDELFQTLTLMPSSKNEPADFDSDIVPDVVSRDRELVFCKTLSQSDVNNSEELLISRHCGERLFPHMVVNFQQTIEALDVQGKRWKFTHVYRYMGKGHMLIEGWSQFMNAKKLVAGDSIMLFKTSTGYIFVCIKRCKKRVEGGDVIEAMNRAARGEAFDVVYCIGDSAPACVVLESLVKPKLQKEWGAGMRVKFDSSDFRSFTGTIVSVDAADPDRWPDSPWGRLQVQWDVPGQLGNVTRVNPWLVEPTSDLHHVLPHMYTFKQAIDGQIRYLVGPSHMFTLACIQPERRGDKTGNPSEGSSSGFNQPDVDEQSLG